MIDLIAVGAFGLYNYGLGTSSVAMVTIPKKTNEQKLLF